MTSRITSTHTESIDRFSSSGAMDAGQVNLISLDAVVERLAERWQGRREAVYEMVERVLDKRVGPNGHYTRISETDFLVAQPDRGSFAGQAVCLRSLGEILKHFLGAAEHHDLRVRQVTAIEDFSIIAVPIDPKKAIEGETREVRAEEEASRLAAFEAQANADAELLSPDRWSPFVGANGRKVRVSCKLEPVFELKGNTRIGFRLARQVVDVASDVVLPAHEVANLARADHMRIDMATIARGLARMESNGDKDQALSLIIPVSYITLSHQEGRQKLAQAFARARRSVLKGVLCEICDIEGVPQAGLISAISMIRPWSLFVIGHLAGDTPRADASMKDTGLQAMAVTCPAGIEGDAEFLGWLKEASASARKVAKSVMVYGCSPHRVAMAGLLGATHASVR